MLAICLIHTHIYLLMYLHSCIGARSFSDSRYGKPNKTVLLSNVACNGSESRLDECDAAVLSPDGAGKGIVLVVDIAGVSCKTAIPTMVEPSNVTDVGMKSNSSKEHGVIAGLVMVSLLGMITAGIVIRYVDL